MTNPHLLVSLGIAFSIALPSFAAASATSSAGKLAIKTSAKCMWRAFAPVAIAGVLAIYGLIIAVILAPHLQQEDLSVLNGYKCLAAGMTVGFACAGSGFGMNMFLGSSMLTPYSASGSSVGAEPRPEQERLLMGAPPQQPTPPSNSLLMTMVFLEAIGLYGLVVALLLVPQ